MNLLQTIKSKIFATVQAEPIANNAFCAASPEQQKEVTDLVTKCGIAVFNQMQPSDSHHDKKRWKRATKKMAKRLAKERDAQAGG